MKGGSNRKYERVTLPDGRSAVRTEGTCREENEAFVYLAGHFRSAGLNVPEVYEVSADGMSYVQEDLGDCVLYDAVSGGRAAGEYSEGEIALLCRAVRELPRFQLIGSEGLDYGCCYPAAEFDERLIAFDLNYFKYCFLKPSGLEFNEVRLQDDFDALSRDLLEAGLHGFMYRDFQARNVMLRGGDGASGSSLNGSFGSSSDALPEPWFIDFQGGRRGPLYYDLASFICQARSRFSPELKERLISEYLSAAREIVGMGSSSGVVGRVSSAGGSRLSAVLEDGPFRAKLRIFMLFRCLQTLGAYGFRGLVECKPHFIESIPFALAGIRELLEGAGASGDSSSRTPEKGFAAYPYLCEVLTALCSKPTAGTREKVPGEPLTVEVLSFSYKKGLPVDDSGNGGGYIFDCRAVHNPGRYPEFKNMTGRDSEVIKFLEDDGEVFTFLESVYALVDAHVDRFLERGFTHLQVAFGCTGGQHRSVYCAEALAAHLRSKYCFEDSADCPRLNIILRHTAH